MVLPNNYTSALKSNNLFLAGPAKRWLRGA
jgi:hypothetical protein